VNQCNNWPKPLDIAAVGCHTNSMKNEITYTSPRSGLTYEAKLNTKGYTRYDITLDGRWVQFSLSEEGIAKSVAHAEGVHDGWYCLPRD
jgi:hypothetical protein